jgi:hypothetical protein
MFSMKVLKPLSRARQPDAASAGQRRTGSRLSATLALIVAVMAVQLAGCGYKTQLEIPKKAPPAKSAS